MNEAPAAVDRCVIEQPFDGPRAAPAHTVFDFLPLLGDVEVDRMIAGECNERRELVGRGGAE